MNQKTAKTAPEALAAMINMARGVYGPHGAAGGASRAARAVAYAKPLTDAAHGLYQDAGLIGSALDHILPGTKEFIKHQAGARLRYGAHEALDRLEEAAEKHGPAIRERIGNLAARGLDAVKDKIHKGTAPAALAEAALPPTPEPRAMPGLPTVIGAGLGIGSLGGLGALAVSRKLREDREEKEREKERDAAMRAMMSMAHGNALGKISSALDAIAEEIDERAFTLPQEEKTAEAEPANVFGQFYEFYKQQVGEEPPAALVEKLAQDADEETMSALEKLVKRAGMERPTPLGEPSEGGGYRAPPSSRDDAMKTAWEQFEETLLNYENA